MFNKLVWSLGLVLLHVSVLYSQAFTEGEQKMLKEHAVTIHVDADYTHGDWTPLLKAIGDKKMVLLGEFNHGSKEVFVSRNDLIKSLHDKLGFDVILFESGIGGLAAVDIYRERMNAAYMTVGLIGPWRTREFEDLMGYIKENDIEIGGFDVQRSGGLFERMLEKVANRCSIDSIHYAALESRFTSQKKIITSRQAVYDTVRQSTTTLIEDYNHLYRLFENVVIAEEEDVQLALRTLINRISFLQYRLDFLKDRDWNKRWRDRDLAMANNIEWLIEKFYPNRKVVVIAHNFHIAKYNEHEHVMGEFLKEKYGHSMYSLGVFAGGGTYLGNFGDAKELNPSDADRLDVKDVIDVLDGKVNFLNIRERSQRGIEWLYKKIVVNDTFIDLSSSHEMDLSKHFDGLLLLDKVSVPEKIVWE